MNRLVMVDYDAQQPERTAEGCGAVSLDFMLF